MTAAQPDLRGHVVADRYRIVRLIGSGAMGSVYEAEHVVTRARVALKLLHGTTLREVTSVQRFARECRASAAIGHPGVVQVLDAGSDPKTGELFMAMELLTGEPLRDRLSRDLSYEKRLDLFEELLDPLAAAHARGFVHRDLKPDNIFVARMPETGEDRIKLLDFGLARELADSSMTRAGMAMGTAVYMSPEQWQDAAEALPASDVWSVGVMLYEALAGRPPFLADTLPALALQIHGERQMPLHERSRGVSPRVAELVDRCLAKRPGGRPRDAAELRTALRTARETPVAAAVAVSVATGPAIDPRAATVQSDSAPATQREPAIGHTDATRPPSGVGSAPKPVWPWVVGAAVVVLGLGALGVTTLLGVALVAWNDASRQQAQPVPAVPVPVPVSPVAPIDTQASVDRICQRVSACNVQPYEECVAEGFAIIASQNVTPVGLAQCVACYESQTCRGLNQRACVGCWLVP